MYNSCDFYFRSNSQTSVESTVNNDSCNNNKFDIKYSQQFAPTLSQVQRNHQKVQLTCKYSCNI